MKKIQRNTFSRKIVRPLMAQVILVLGNVIKFGAVIESVKVMG